jgi:hypothetical protein
LCAGNVLASTTFSTSLGAAQRGRHECHGA